MVNVQICTDHLWELGDPPLMAIVAIYKRHADALPCPGQRVRIAMFLGGDPERRFMRLYAFAGGGVVALPPDTAPAAVGNGGIGWRLALAHEVAYWRALVEVQTAQWPDLRQDTGRYHALQTDDDLQRAWVRVMQLHNVPGLRSDFVAVCRAIAAYSGPTGRKEGVG